MLKHRATFSREGKRNMRETPVLDQRSREDHSIEVPIQ
jgi:hypothetical protein